MLDDHLAAVPFRNAANSRALLTERLGDRYNALIAPIARLLREATQPDLLVVRLARYLEACPDRTTERHLLLAAPKYLDLLMTILAQSDFLTDLLCRNPEFMSWLWEEAELIRPVPAEAHMAELERLLDALPSFEARCQALRRFKRREILRIATRDIAAYASMRSVTEDLSNLADAALQFALRCADADMRERFGAPRLGDNEPDAPEAGFCILAMGKLGGRELNFSSDIDLIFIYADEGRTDGGRSGATNNANYFQKVGERIIKAIAEVTSEGYVFRVDMRLRPHGAAAPLAAPLDMTARYYETVGQAWERQALVRMRPVAGDLALGEAFIERIRPFIYPRYFDDETLEDIRRVKMQMESTIEARGETRTEVKLGRGGIRDIEFTVQILQLLNGGRIADLRAPNTLDAIAALERNAILSPFEADTLATNYVFLRRVENRLQVKSSGQVHALPTAPHELDDFARRLGYDDGPSFMSDYDHRTQASRAVLERFVAAEGSGTRWIYDILHPQHGGEAGLAQLRKFGFRNPETAREQFMQLYAGPNDRPNTLRVRQQFTSVAPLLLEAAARCGDPDAVVRRLAQVLARVRATGALYDLLHATPLLCTYLVTLVDNSPYLTDFIVRDPGLFEAFGDPVVLEEPAAPEDVRRQLAELSRSVRSEAAPYQVLAGETLRVGMRDLFLGISVFDVGRELTQLAEAVVEHALDNARRKTERRFGESPAPFCVLALGKMGGAEMGYGSDLDLVFIYDNEASLGLPMSSQEYFAAVASACLNALKERTRYGVLYDVDARLRPDGGKGVLAVGLGRLAEYYRNDAQAWERLALLKGRPVAGDPALRAAVQELTQTLVFERRFTPDELDNIAQVRGRVSDAAGPLDIKRAPGGLIEVEFTARLLQIYHAAEHPALRRGDVLGALQTLTAEGLLSPDDGEALISAYTLFRRIENRMRMAEGSAASELPADPAARRDLGRRLGLSADPAELTAAACQRVHALYEQAINTVG